MLCLVLWGGLLEKRIGALYFLIVYIGAIVGGSIVGTFTHHTEYLSVGASGGISGILGALLCLWILGKINLSLSFFVMNIGLNIVLTMSSSGIDWGAHLGGFAAGLIVCALLDIVEKLNALVFRCKFPEFVKLNSFALLAGFAFYVFKSGQHDPSWQRSPTLAIYAISGVVGLKLLDIVLSRKKGLALVVILFSVANAAVACLLGPMLVKDQCAAGHLFDVVCTNADIAVAALAASICALTIMVCLDALRRGMTDVGFVGATLHAERRRSQGL
jgi:rhomboid protease GluP